MDGRNSTGRTISLLNDSSEIAAYRSKIQLSSVFAAHSRATSSSCESTPSITPQTPQLSRSSSSDSRSSLASPSPLTPSHHYFENPTSRFHGKSQDQQHCYIAQHTDSKMDDPNVILYPPIPDATAMMPSAYPMPPQLQPQLLPQMPQQPMQPTQRLSNSPSSEPSRLSTVSATSNPKSQPKKNQYPCPMAKQVGCADHFTTSGHAARHAKKHTGKKDAFCPECNKAFTRKDNMEQHRRTHQTGRSARGNGSTATSDESKVKKPAKTSKKSTIKAESQQLEAAVEEMMTSQPPLQPIIPTTIAPQVAQAQQAQVLQQVLLEQAMMGQPAGPYFLGNTIDTGPVPALPMAVPDLSMRPPLHRSSLTNSLDYIPPTAPLIMGDPDLHYSYPSPGLSNGLNSLALAASEHKRWSEEKEQSRSPQGSPLQRSSSSDSETP